MPSLTINTNADLGDADTKKVLMTKLTQVLPASCALGPLHVIYSIAPICSALLAAGACGHR